MRILALLICCSFTQALIAKSLFTFTSVVDRETLQITERAASVVGINAQLLLDKTQQFDIQLPNGINSTAVFNRLETHSKGKFSWFGHLKGQPQEQMIISVVKGYYAGSLYTKAGVFEFTSAGKHQMRIAELATDHFPECDGQVLPVETEAHIEYPHSDIQTSFGAVEFDVMVLYTPQARDAAGGTAAIEATAQAALDAMNLSYINSQVTAQGSLSYTGLVNYSDSGDTGDDLGWLRTNDYVNQLRTAYGADMVTMLVNSGGCGTGYVMRSPGAGFADFAYQVTKRTCAVGNLTFAHEFGHNMGLEHNPENSSTEPEDASNPWSYGHYHNSYRTVMSYSSPCGGCTRQQYFSNPDVQFNDLDTGIDGERDNARTLNQTAAIVASFRPPANDTIFEDGFE